MQSKPFWEMTEQEYIQATGMPKQVLPYSPGYAEYEKWKRTNLNYFEMVEKSARAGKRIPDAIVASLPAGVRARVKSDLPKTEKQFNREYVIHGSKSCLDFIEPRIGDFTRDSYSGSGEGTFEEMGGKEYAYFRNPEDIDLVLQYAGDSGCVMVSSLPGDALFVKQDGLYNEYGELVSQDVGTGPEDGDIISEQGAGVLFQIPVEQWKRSGEKSIYSYLKKKMRRTITNPKDPRSAMTQIAGTEDTYINASKMLGGKVLDYGAGIGIGTDALRSNGLLTDSFEPFPENWEGKLPPTYTDSADIPSESYDSMVSFSVINVVDPDERKLLFREVSRILRPDGVALITGRTRQDVGAATTKIPHLEEGGYLIGKGKRQRYQKGFTQAELERYAKEVLGPGFTVEKNGMLNGASIKITKGKTNPTKRNAIRNKLSRIIESDDRILCYDTAADEDFYRLWDIIHTDLTLNKESLREIEGMLDDDGVLVIESGETPAGLQDHFRKTTRYQGLLLVQGPLNPEQARIETEKLRRDLE